MRRIAAAIAVLGALATAGVASHADATPTSVAPARGDPADGAVAAAIRTAAPPALAAFYRQRGYWPLWSDRGQPGPQAAALVALIDGVAVDGLDPADYATDDLRRLIDAAGQGDAAAMARADVALSAAFTALVRDMRRPRIGLRYLDPEVEPLRPDDAEILRRAALTPSLADYIGGLQWMSPLYVGLRTALGGTLPVRTHQRIRSDDGSHPPRIELDRRDVAIFGAPYRRVPDRAVTSASLIASRNGPRARLLRVNLERARLLPGPWTPHIVVDAAGARLWYFGGGAEQGTMKVVVGKPATPTPMMAGVVRYVTLNPYWNVPTNLVATNIAPKVAGGASLTSLGYELLSDWTQNAVVVDPATVDWRAVAAGQQEVRVRELPGDGNSMGTVKFQFPNPDGIYLHDTPNRALFAKANRHFSNGCVRLEDAPRLGRWLLGQPLTTRSSDPEQVIALDRPVPIYLLYFTAVPTADGVAFANDAYGRDAAVAKQVAAK